MKDSMKAIQYASYGGPENLALVEVPLPKVAADEVRIRVISTSVNPIDWKLASGAFRFLRPVRRPAIPGFDVVGEVLESGAQMAHFVQGQRIVARMDSPAGAGCAEQCVVTKAQAVALPDAVSSADAAALPLAAMTALQALRDDCGMHMKSSEARVLIVGASGGVGHYAVQLARLAGAHVTGVCSTKNVDLVRELGADQVIDYRKQDHYNTDAPYDIVVDCAGKSDWSVFDACMADDGKIALPAPRLDWAGRFLMSKIFGRRTLSVTMLKPNAADLQGLVDQLHTGQLRSVVGATFPLEQTADAWRASIRGGVPGKIVIQVAE